MFDNIAESYYSFTPALPEKYIDLLNETFLVQQNDSIIDLGCGSGELALKFAKWSTSVEGVDVSNKMISMARQKDINNKVRWIKASADEFDFGKSKYKLIFAFEAFHLFSKQQEIIRRCTKGLKQDGSLCIGWATYEWEPWLRRIIIEVFASYGVHWDEWGNWTCPTFPTQLAEVNGTLGFPLKKHVAIETTTSIKDIINYLFSISKTAFLDDSLKLKISQELQAKFMQVFPSGRSEGKTYYNIIYSTNYSLSKSKFKSSYLTI